MDLRWMFEGIQGFSPLFLQSRLPARPPCHPTFPHSSLYPYRPCRSQKATPHLRRRHRPTTAAALGRQVAHDHSMIKDSSLIYTLGLSLSLCWRAAWSCPIRSEEHTSELQS